MLLKEYTLDPDLFAQPDLIKIFIRDFGMDKGRVLSLVPKSWLRLAADQLNKTSNSVNRKEAEIIISTLQKWKMQGIAIRSPSRKSVEYMTPWIQYVEGFKTNPFDGVLTQKESEKSLKPDTIWLEPPQWQVDSSATVPLLASKFLPYLHRLFSVSEQINIIDPYFNLEDSKYWPFWEGLAQLVVQHDHIKKIVFITADHKAPNQILGRSQERLAMIKNLEVYIARADQVEGGMHDRFILSDVAGFSFSNSFQEKPDELVEIARLGSKSYQCRVNQFVNSLHKFQLLTI
ncbi:hypothetical protein [Thiomicrospira microaerophila]|uniref:hypothetical protein n=1 Tax=Thiomicrospira microaerophila TaxID=406020 RepID=UPI0005CA69F3|nr:hypothetical protein [Thiomicrospira microaerophila]